MKIGMRTPSPTRSLKAKTTGRAKRAINKSVNPVYGHKGIGYLKDPERAVKNKIYHKVTVDPLDGMKNAEMPDIDIPISEQHETPKKGTFLQCVACIAMLGSLIYTIYKLFAYNQLHLRGVFVFVVSVIIIERINK